MNESDSIVNSLSVFFDLNFCHPDQSMYDSMLPPSNAKMVSPIPHSFWNFGGWGGSEFFLLHIPCYLAIASCFLLSAIFTNFLFSLATFSRISNNQRMQEFDIKIYRKRKSVLSWKNVPFSDERENNDR